MPHFTCFVIFLCGLSTEEESKFNLKLDFLNGFEGFFYDYFCLDLLILWTVLPQGLSEILSNLLDNLDESSFEI